MGLRAYGIVGILLRIGRCFHPCQSVVFLMNLRNGYGKVGIDSSKEVSFRETYSIHNVQLLGINRGFYLN
jgi:hypothetical protein